jgi:hypothetical protein
MISFKSPFKKKSDKKNKDFFKKKQGFGKDTNQNQTRVLTGRQISLIARNTETSRQVTLKLVGTKSGASKVITITVAPQT